MTELADMGEDSMDSTDIFESEGYRVLRDFYERLPIAATTTPGITIPRRHLKAVRQFLIWWLCLALQVPAGACIFDFEVPIPTEQLTPADTGPYNDTGPLMDELPENPGYLVAAPPLEEPGFLTVFDADTFEVFRTVEVITQAVGYLRWVEVGPQGKVWAGYVASTPLIGSRPGSSGVMVFSPEGGLVKDLEIGCNPPNSGVAFAGGYAFIGCAASGFTGMVIVVDPESLEVVKTLDNVHPPGEDVTAITFYIDTVAEVAGAVLVIGSGFAPEGYSPLTHHSAHYTRVGVIDPETLEFRGFLTGLEPGLLVLGVIEVDGKAWLLNQLSHWEERPDRTDVYVMDVQTLEVADRFNLERLFPNWGEWGDDGAIYIFHEPPSYATWESGHISGVTRLDPETGQERFTYVPNPPRVTGMRLNGNRACMPSMYSAGRGIGLWCLNAEGELELKSPKTLVMDVAFRSSSR